MMEIMKVWYVITYRSSSDLDPDAPRSLRVARVDPNTGDPLLIVDANGKTIPARVVAEDSDTPAKSFWEVDGGRVYPSVWYQISCRPVC